MDNGQDIRTIADVSQAAGRTVEALRKSYKRRWPDRSFSAGMLLRPDERDYFVATYKIGAHKVQKSIVVQPVAPQPALVVAERPSEIAEQLTPKRKVSVLDIINYTDMALILSGCVIMLDWVVGILVGGMIVGFFYDTLETVKRPDAYESRYTGLFVSGCLLVLSGGLHFITARTVLANTRANLPLGVDFMSFIIAFVISCISLSALVQASNKTTDNL